MRPRDALEYASRQAEYMGINDRMEDQVYWEKIGVELDKQILARTKTNAPKSSPPRPNGPNPLIL